MRLSVALEAIIDTLQWRLAEEPLLPLFRCAAYSLCLWPSWLWPIWSNPECLQQSTRNTILVFA